MPKQHRSSKRIPISQPLAIAFLLIVVGIFVYQQYQARKASSTGGGVTVATPSDDIRIAGPTETPAAEGVGTSSIQAWFTNPLDDKLPGPETKLVDAINGAKKTVDMAIYNLTLENVSESLIAAHKRGVVVRIVMESEAIEKKVPQAMVKAGIPIQGDNREGLMHNKFTIIDKKEVWTGSFNLASTSAYNDYNNLIRIRSDRVVQDYQVEFNEMFIEGLFGPTSRANTPYPKVDVDGVAVEVYFSPEDDVADHVIEAIKGAKTSIEFLAYSFTSDDIAQVMRERASVGVKVRGVFDESQVSSNKGGEYAILQKDGFDVRLDGISGLLHHKVIIIDGQVVITGSYNFSSNAERVNDENLVIVRSATLARQYQVEFENVYKQGK